MAGRYADEFEKGFRGLCASENPRLVWGDLWELFAIAIANAPTTCRDPRGTDLMGAVRERRERRYLHIISHYSEQEAKRISDLLGCVVMELDCNPWQDFAGAMYMRLGIGNRGAGQFFTPYSVCQLMTKLNGDVSEVVDERGWCSVYDCACGGGATLIAACEGARLSLEGRNWQNHVLLLGNDIDRTCVHMCYVQLALLGAAAVVTRSDAMRTSCVDFYEDPDSVWMTPMYLSPVWELRRLAHGYDMNMEGMWGRESDKFPLTQD